MVVKQMTSNREKVVGIIAATICDAKLGASQIMKKGFKAIPFYISPSPNQQTALQNNKNLLTKKVILAIEFLINEGASFIVIYCYSMSLSIDMNSILNKFQVKIISPLEIVKDLKFSSTYVGLMCANNIALSNSEKIFSRLHPKIKLIGVGAISIVESIEKSIEPNLLIKKHGIIKIFEFFKLNNCHDLILGCTHFEYFYQELLYKLNRTNNQLNCVPIFDLLLKKLIEIVNETNPSIAPTQPSENEAYFQQHHT